MTQKQQSLSYEELSRAGRDIIDRLAEGACSTTPLAPVAHTSEGFSRGWAKWSAKS
jgi:hypothetical protein